MTEAYINDITEYSHGHLPSTGMFGFYIPYIRSLHKAYEYVCVCFSFFAFLNRTYSSRSDIMLASIEVKYF